MYDLECKYNKYKNKSKNIVMTDSPVKEKLLARQESIRSRTVKHFSLEDTERNPELHPIQPIRSEATLWSLDNFWGNFVLWGTSAIVDGLKQEIVISMKEDRMKIRLTDEFFRVRRIELSRFAIEDLIKPLSNSEELKAYNKRPQLLSTLIRMISIDPCKGKKRTKLSIATENLSRKGTNGNKLKGSRRQSMNGNEIDTRVSADEESPLDGKSSLSDLVDPHQGAIALQAFDDIHNTHIPYILHTCTHKHTHTHIHSFNSYLYAQ